MALCCMIAPVDVVQFGLERSVYNVMESDGTLEVCVVASFLDIAQGSITFDIFTEPSTPETAIGK